jgi:hypothetical protein
MLLCHSPEATMVTNLNSSGNRVQLGNVWIGVQPLLGVEGDPMRYATPVYSLSHHTTPCCASLSDLYLSDVVGLSRHQLRLAELGVFSLN